MANQKLTDRTLYAATLADADLVHVVDVSDTTQDAAGSSFKLQLTQLKTYIGAWSLLGNSGTNPSTNFLGTTDSQDLVFRTNNTEKVRLTTAGYFGVGGTPTRGIQLFGTDSTNGEFKISQATDTSTAAINLVNDNEAFLKGNIFGSAVSLNLSHNFIDADNASVGGSKGLYLYSWGSTVSKGIFFYTGSSTSSSQKMEINHNGFIGMGVAAIANQLVTIKGQSTSSTEFSLVVHNSTGSNNSFIVTNDGRIGIRTAAPESIFHVNNGTNSEIKFASQGTGLGIFLTRSSGDFVNKIYPDDVSGDQLLVFNSRSGFRYQINSNTNFELRQQSSTVYCVTSINSTQDQDVVLKVVNPTSATYATKIEYTNSPGSPVTIYSLHSSITSTQTGTNIAGYFSATNATKNYALFLDGHINSNIQTGNAGLVAGDLYKDTAANILANADYVVGMKA